MMYSRLKEPLSSMLLSYSNSGQLFNTQILSFALSLFKEDSTLKQLYAILTTVSLRSHIVEAQVTTVNLRNLKKTVHAQLHLSRVAFLISS